MVFRDPLLLSLGPPSRVLRVGVLLLFSRKAQTTNFVMADFIHKTRSRVFCVQG